MIGSVIVALLLRVGGTGLFLLFSILVARTMSIEDFGFVFFAINVAITGGSIAVLGYDVTLLRFGSQFWRDGRRQELADLLFEARSVILVFGLLVLAVFLLLALRGLDTPVTNSPLVAAFTGLSIVATALVAAERDALRSAGRLQEALFATSIIRAVVPLALAGLAVALQRMTAIGAVGFYLAGLLASLLWDRWRLGRLNLPRHSPMIRPSHWRTALSILPGDAALILLQRAPGVVIGISGSLEAAALYLAAERIAQLGTFLTDAVRTAIGPMLAQAEGDGRQAAVTQASILMVASGLIGTLALLALGWLLLLAFGREYLSALPVLFALLAGQLSWTLLGPTALIMNMLGAERLRSLITAVSTALLFASLPFCDTALEAAVVAGVLSWLMNGVLWLAIRLKLGLRAGLPGIGRQDWGRLGREEFSAVIRQFNRFRRQ